MGNTIKIAYGSTAGTTAKNNSAQGELSFSPTNDILWIGKGSNTQIAIGGTGKFVTLDTNQTISGTKTFSSTISGSISGTAGSAATWTTARTFTIGSTGKSVNGSANISWTLGEIGAAATSHSHGNITSAGAIGSTASLPIITTTSGVLTTGSFGTAANTFCQGNDSRLSDARTPVGTTLTSGQIYVGSNLNTAAAVALSGDATLTNAGVITIANNAITTAKIADANVTLAKIANVSALSVLGNSTASSGVVEEITGTTQYHVLQIVSKGTLELDWGLIGTNSIANDAVTFAKMQNSAAAGLSVIGRSTNSAGDFAEINAGTDGFVLRRSGTAVGFGEIATAGIANDAVTFAKMQNSAAAGLSVIGRSTNSAGDFAEINAGTDGFVLRRSGTAVGFGEIATAGIANNAVTVAKIEQVAGRSILGRNANTTGNLSVITASGSGQILTSTTGGLQWSNSVDGWNTKIRLKGDFSQLPTLPTALDYSEFFYISQSGKLYSVRGNEEDEEQEELILLCGGTQLIMYSDAAPEAEDTYLILSSIEKIRLTKVTFVCGAGTCTNAKLKKISGVNTSDIVTFSVNTTISNTTSLNTTHREIAIGDRLLFNPGTLSSGTTPEDLVLQIEYIPGSEGLI